MYNVLIVDDDKYALSILNEQLKIYGDLFTPIYARNGQDAQKILEQQHIALVVTDLMMPGEINGWDLIDYIEDKYANLPLVVITGCAEEDKLKLIQKKIRDFFSKPFKLKQLVDVVIDILDKDITDSNLQEISVGFFLQLLEVEEKTCLLEIISEKDERGFLYIDKGILFDAVYGNLRNHKAASGLIALENPSLKFKPLPRKKIPRRIKSDLTEVILEAMSLKEGHQETSNQPHVVEPEKTNVTPDEPEPEFPARPGQDISEQQDNQKTGNNIPQNQKECNLMALEENLATLRSINGYKASALMNFTGEVLAADTIDQNIDLASVGAVFNDIFRTSHEAAGKVGLKVCDEMTLKTPNGIVIMSCSGVDAAVHFHIIVVLNQDGNQALAKMQLDKLTAGFMAELS